MRTFLLLWVFLVAKLEAITNDELAEELSGQYQGDLLITDEQMAIYRKKKLTKNGLINKRFRWQEARVPYKISTQYYGTVLV